jgi:hypothetical protein
MFRLFLGACFWMIASLLLRAQQMDSTRFFLHNLTEIQQPSTFSFNPPGRWAIFDRTYNANRDWQKKPFIANADVRICVPLFAAQIGKKEHQKWLFATQLQAGLMVRMFQNDTAQGDQSYSVRTPSYLPGIAFFVTHQRFFNSSRPWRHYGGLRIWHHSNGQDGYELINEGWANTYNGDFAERVNVEGYWGWLYQKSPLTLQRFWGQVGWDWRPPQLVNGRFTFYDMYAHRRLHIIANWEQQAESKENNKRAFCRFSTDWVWIADAAYGYGPAIALQPVSKTDAAKRLNATATFTFYPRHWQTRWGIFVQGGYYGSDPYNIYFQQQMWFYRVGIAGRTFMF